MNQQHEMILEVTHSSGAEEWYCPTCGRRMMITWEPWKRIVLEQGDMYAAHSGGKGGLRLRSMGITQGYEIEQPSSLEPPAEDTYLAPWARWLENVDLDDLANGED